MAAVGYLLLHPVSNRYPLTDTSITDRGGALWLAASYLPSFLGSGALFWLLFPLGLLCLQTLMLPLISRQDHSIPIALAWWAAASMANSRTYQKYYEPFILFIIGYCLVAEREKQVVRVRWAAALASRADGHFVSEVLYGRGGLAYAAPHWEHSSPSPARRRRWPQAQT